MNITSNNLATLIKRRRKQLRLTQRDVHQRLDWKVKNTQYLSNIELGKCQMPAKHLNKLCIALMLTREDIVKEMVKDYQDALIKELNK